MKILDCTLRDGGYVNNWEFSRECFERVVLGCEKLKIDAVEVGLLGGKPNGERFTTHFSDVYEIPDMPVMGDIDLAVMGTITELKDFSFPMKEETCITAIRLAFFKQDYKETIKLCSKLQERGYKVFLQAMATFLYSQNELLDMLKEVNMVSPYAFYMVDSFGVMYPEDIAGMYSNIRGQLKQEINIGFHAHNNMQLAFANAIKFIEIANENDYLDASFLGMGRGAGNLNMELLLRYLNERKGGKYNLEEQMELIEKTVADEWKNIHGVIRYRIIIRHYMRRIRYIYGIFKKME